MPYDTYARYIIYYVPTFILIIYLFTFLYLPFSIVHQLVLQLGGVCSIFFVVVFLHASVCSVCIAESSLRESSPKMVIWGNLGND